MKNSMLRKVLTVALLTVLSSLLMAAGAEATHGRYGTISWFAPDPAFPHIIRIRMESAWRRSFPWGGTFTGNVGQVTPPGILGPLTITRVGGGFSTSVDVRVTVTSVNAAEDYFVGEFIATVSLPISPTSAQYLISFENCCRVSSLREGNNDQTLRLQSTATIAGIGQPANRSPVTTLLPIMKLQVNTANSFVIPSFDPDSDPISFTFSTSAESGLPCRVPNGTVSGFVGCQIPKLTLSATGQVSWTPTVTGLYAMQVRVTDSKGASIPIDVILDVGIASGTAPTLAINGNPGPANFSVQVGFPISFTVSANDVDIDPATGQPNTFVTMSSGGLPGGAAMTPSLPTVQRVPFSSTFNWTPTTPGTYAIAFAATDASGKQTITSVTIQVLNNLAPVVTCPSNQSADAVDASGVELTFTVGATDPENLAFSVGWRVNGTLVETDSVPAGAGATSVSLTRTLPIGTHTISARADDGRLDGVSTCSFTVEVKKKPQTIDFTTVGPQTYGGQVTLSATATSGLAVEFNVISGPATISGSVLSFHGASDVVLEASQDGDAVWAAATAVLQTITVNRAPLSVKVTNADRPYGAPNPTFTVSYTGFVNDDDTSALGGTVAFDTPANATSDVGNYPVSASGLTSDNYQIGFVDGTLTINPAGLTITIEPAFAVYGEVPGPYTLKYVGFQNLETPTVLIGTVTFATAAVQGSPVGTYDVTPGSLTALNYAIAFQPGVLTITHRPLTVTADPTTKVYGAPLPSFNASYSGFAPGDGPASLNGLLTFATSASASSDVGDYSVTPGSVSSPNYSIGFVPGTLSITKAGLSVVAQDNTRPYGDPNPALTGALTGVVNGDPITAAFATVADPTSAVGSYPITPTLNDPNSRLGNYTVSSQNGSLVITAAPLSVVVDDKSRQVGEANPPLTGSVTGIKNGDPITATYSTTATPGSAPGSYPITATLNDPAGKLGNYAVNIDEGTLVVGYGICLQYDTSKTHKRGSTIPIKLQLCDADGQNLSSPALVLTAFEVLFVSSSVSGDPEDSGSANPDGNFRYVDSGYIFNLQTKGLRIGTYHLRFRATGDPTVHIAPFQVR